MDLRRKDPEADSSQMRSPERGSASTKSKRLRISSESEVGKNPDSVWFAMEQLLAGVLRHGRGRGE